MAMLAASLLPTEGICCSVSYGITCNLVKFPIGCRRVYGLASMRSRYPSFGSSQFLWLSMGHDLCLSKVCVAADYSDSVPDSSDCMKKQRYHPLEELKDPNGIRQTKLSPAEIARTTLEANRNALLVFPQVVHCEPHEQISWAQFQYLVDDYGDIYFEMFDDENILENPGTSNPVNALIGMEIPIYDNERIASEYNIFIGGNADDFDDYYVEIVESGEYKIPVNREMPYTATPVHPIYFSKCLIKAVNMECDKRMNHPSNGVSILGYLRPTFLDDKSYLRMVNPTEDDQGFKSDWEDDGNFCSKSISNQRGTGLAVYRLEILKMTLYSVCGSQSEISVLEFQDAEPDVLVHCSSAISEHFNQMCNVALKTLCKKKGLDVEGARLIGIDCLGMDVRVSSGSEVKTHRFPFKAPATSEFLAEKQIRQLLFPKSRRKKCMN